MFNPAAGRPTNQQNIYILLVSRAPTWPLGLLLSLVFRTPNKNFRTVVQCHLFSRGITIQILNTYSDRIKLAPPSLLGLYKIEPMHILFSPQLAAYILTTSVLGRSVVMNRSQFKEYNTQIPDYHQKRIR